MFLHPLFHRWKLHIVAKEMAQILVVFLRQRHFDVLKGEHLSLAKPFLGEYLLIAVRAGIYLHIAGLVIVLAMTYLFHLSQEITAHLGATEVGYRLDDKAAPLLGICEQMYIFAK